MILDLCVFSLNSELLVSHFNVKYFFKKIHLFDYQLSLELVVLRKNDVCVLSEVIVVYCFDGMARKHCRSYAKG